MATWRSAFATLPFIRFSFNVSFIVLQRLTDRETQNPSTMHGRAFNDLSNAKLSQRDLASSRLEPRLAAPLNNPVPDPEDYDGGF